MTVQALLLQLMRTRTSPKLTLPATVGVSTATPPGRSYLRANFFSVREQSGSSWLLCVEIH